MVSMQRAVVRLATDGERRYGSGDLPGAIDCHRRACGLVREAIETGSQSRANHQQLGSMLYTLGQWELEAGEHAAALATLTEAESSYQRLGSLGGPAAGGVDPAQLVADVVIRRARVNADARRPLSAISDAQQAVLSCLARIDGGPGDPRLVDAARVMSFAAQVQFAVGGDPDLVVGAADWALQVYVAAFRTGDQLAVPAVHALPVRVAAQTAYAVHAAAGRGELAQAARAFATLGGGPPVDLDRAAAVAALQPTLADMLRQTGQSDLVEALTAAATDVRLFVPASRCSPQVAPAYAVSLARIQSSGSVDGAGEVLLGLEAHALFAAASQARALSMRYQFGDFGPHWVGALLNYGQRHAEHDVWPAALDAVGWLNGVVGQLFPFAMIDVGARRAALGAIRWQQAIYLAVGDTAVAADLDQAIATLERLGDRSD